jgi:hypothetical protein
VPKRLSRGAERVGASWRRTALVLMLLAGSVALSHSSPAAASTCAIDASATALIDGNTLVGLTDVACARAVTVVTAEAQLRVEKCFVACASFPYGHPMKQTAVNQDGVAAADTKPCTTGNYHVASDARWVDYPSAEQSSDHVDSGWTDYQCFELPSLNALVCHGAGGRSEQAAQTDPIDPTVCPVLQEECPPEGDIDGIWDCPPYSTGAQAVPSVPVP